jgi:hypothetical protein
MANEENLPFVAGDEMSTVSWGEDVDRYLISNFQARSCDATGLRIFVGFVIRLCMH